MENKGSIIKIVGKILEKVVMIIIVFISAIILTQQLTDNSKAFLGYRIFRVQTGSMIPVYDIGDVILVKEKNIDEITVGDDITYWGTSGAMKGKIVTHRVIDKEILDGKNAFHTKGVANNAKDPIVYPEQINGVVQGKLHFITWICSLLSNRYIFYFCGILPLTIIIFFNVLKANNKKIERYQDK